MRVQELFQFFCKASTDGPWFAEVRSVTASDILASITIALLRNIPDCNYL